MPRNPSTMKKPTTKMRAMMPCFSSASFIALPSRRAPSVPSSLRNANHIRLIAANIGVPIGLANKSCARSENAMTPCLSSASFIALPSRRGPRVPSSHRKANHIRPIATNLGVPNRLANKSCARHPDVFSLFVCGLGPTAVGATKCVGSGSGAQRSEIVLTEAHASMPGCQIQSSPRSSPERTALTRSLNLYGPKDSPSRPTNHWMSTSERIRLQGQTCHSHEHEIILSALSPTAMSLVAEGEMPKEAAPPCRDRALMRALPASSPAPFGHRFKAKVRPWGRPGHTGTARLPWRIASRPAVEKEATFNGVMGATKVHSLERPYSAPRA